MRWFVCCLVLAAVCGCAQQPGSGRIPVGGAALPVRDPAAQHEAELVTHAAQHPFWRVPVSEAQIRDLVSQAVQLQAPDVLYADREFHVHLAHNDWIARSLFDSLRRDPGMVQTPEGLSSPIVYVDMQEFGTRPDRATFLEVLLQRLDRADFARPNR